MHSCIYEGNVWHSRREPVVHRIQKRLFMAYLDLDELSGECGARRLVAESNWAALSFRRDDHLFDASLPLAEEVRQIVRDQTGTTPNGPIRLLTQLRHFGYFFSPLNVFYCFDSSGTLVQSVVAEVNNTPWGERHCYVLWAGNQYQDCEYQVPGDHRVSEATEMLPPDPETQSPNGKPACEPTLRYCHDKTFHVSPFMDMDMRYRWQIGTPGDDLRLSIANVRHEGLDQERTLFEAGMSLRRRELSRSELRRQTIHYPFLTAQIVAAIYYHAFRLWWKKCPYFTHPQKQVAKRTSVP